MEPEKSIDHTLSAPWIQLGTMSWPEVEDDKGPGEVETTPKSMDVFSGTPPKKKIAEALKSLTKTKSFVCCQFSLKKKKKQMDLEHTKKGETKRGGKP